MRPLSATTTASLSGAPAGVMVISGDFPKSWTFFEFRRSKLGLLVSVVNFQLVGDMEFFKKPENTL